MITLSALLLILIHFTLCIPHKSNESPVLKLEVFSPKGFKASIPDEEGIEQFEFHGNVNKPIRGLDGGQFHKNVLSKTGRSWVYINNEAVLNSGDELCFWVVVLHNGVRDVFSGELTIKDVDINPSNFTTRMTSDPNNNRNTIILKPDTLCNLAFNLSKSVEELTEEVENLREINDILTRIISSDENLSKSLKFKGALPPIDDPEFVVQIILQEKLDLRIAVVNVTKENENSIKFEVANLQDKILIIKSARGKLEKMKSKIILQY